ncbi:transcriptional regulator [Stutzerimonas nosocomialis]|uniref:helix-turn-helix transcriptional regulator n=1 Tax=Stutzerimonas nosocomialis TaxID=1056496 RepID=UPI001108523E|nr:helix-turn-helix transcriptional regulator [Stutzerimonas nosocomialis]TLX54002.1 transcriptional regulator [Stutzerimonas nosocomialis]
MAIEERDRLIRAICQDVAEGRLDMPEAIRQLRVEVTGLNQATFARMCKISMRALNHLEHGDGNPTLKTLQSVFKVFGMRISLAMVDAYAGPTEQARSSE